MTNDLNRLFAQGPFSDLDIHFARFMTRLSGRDLPELFVAAALVSHATTNGHVCLPLSSVAEKPLLMDESAPPAFVCPGLGRWCEALIASGVVGKPGDFKPLILDDHSRIYLYRYWQYERALAEDLRLRASQPVPDLNLDLLRDGLSRLFPPPPEAGPDWQEVAACISVMKGVSVISGGPGTGKSFLIARIMALLLELCPDHHMRIALTAPTGKAAARLQEAIKKGKETLAINGRTRPAIPVEASTIHRLLGTIQGSPYFRHHAENPLPVDLVVVDEASMVDLALMSKLVQAIPSHARLILLGDKDQLASVEAGAVLGDICDPAYMPCFSRQFAETFQHITGNTIPVGPNNRPEHPMQDCVVQLQKSYRFGSDSGIGEVSRAVNAGRGELALALLKKGGYPDITWRPLPASGRLAKELREIAIQHFRPYLDATDPLEIFSLFDEFRFLCALRKGPYGVSAFNSLIEHILHREGLIAPEKRWYAGCPILITQNDYNLGLFNGDIGMILPDPAFNDELRAYFLSSNGTTRKVLPTRLPEHQTAYAMTVHKSQGSEFNRALLILPDRLSPVLTRELIYTGITRARQGVEVWAREGVFLEGVERQTQRTSGLRDALWGEESLLRDEQDTHDGISC